MEYETYETYEADDTYETDTAFNNMYTGNSKVNGPTDDLPQQIITINSIIKLQDSVKKFAQPKDTYETYETYDTDAANDDDLYAGMNKKKVGGGR